MKLAMIAISIHLPGKLAKASQKLAAKLQVTRAQFIRMAIEHEIKRRQIHEEQLAMVKCFSFMKKNKEYLAESEEIMQGFNTPLDDEKEQWWKKK